MPKKVTLPRLLLAGLILLYFIYFGLYARQRHLAFETGAFDLAVYAQPLWNFNQGRGFSLSLIPDQGPVRWATHVEPILFLLGPLYGLWTDPRLLLWLQVAALSLAALPLYGLACRRLGGPPSIPPAGGKDKPVLPQEGGVRGGQWAALVVVLAYFLMPATEAVTLFDFHAVSLAPLFLLSAIYFLDRALEGGLWLWPKVEIKASPATGRYYDYSLAGLFFLLALSTKEDISLVVFMIGLYLLVLRRRWREGIGLMVVGLAWFYVAFQVVIPAFRVAGGQSIYIDWFQTLGDTPVEIALSPLTRPRRVLALLFQPGKLPALAMLTAPQAILPLFGLPLLAPAIPSLAMSLLSQNPTLRQLETWHYAAPMLPFVMLATIDGMGRLAHYGRRYRLSLRLLSLLLLVTAGGYHHWRGYSHLAKLTEWPQATAHHQLGRELAAAIPSEAALLGQAQLLPQAAHRRELGIWSGPLLTDYDYIWLDLSHPKFPNRFNAQGELLTGLVIEESFGFVATQDGYLLLKKGVKRKPISEALFTFTAFDRLPPEAQPVEAIFGDTFKLTGVRPEVRRLATSETEPQLMLYFETLQSPGQDYRLFIYRVEPGGKITAATDYAQPGLVWWPTSRWQAGERRRVRVNTIPWWTGDQGIFGYAVGFSRRDDPWDVSARLPVSAKGPLLSEQTLLPVVAFRRLAGLPYPQPLTVLRLE